MAIFHMSFSNISAGKGRSAIASAAYRSGEKLFDNQEGKLKALNQKIKDEKNKIEQRLGKQIISQANRIKVRR